jgi:hypothetical protein
VVWTKEPPGESSPGGSIAVTMRSCVQPPNPAHITVTDLMQRRKRPVQVALVSIVRNIGLFVAAFRDFRAKCWRTHEYYNFV